VIVTERGVPVNAAFNAVLLTESANAAALVESVVGEGVTPELEPGTSGGAETGTAGSDGVTGTEAGVVGLVPCAGG
jgi:hypothetical protein